MDNYLEENEIEDFSEVEFRKSCECLEELVDEFCISDYYKKLTEREKSRVAFIIHTYHEYSYNYDEPGIENWDEYSMKECCLEILPRKISADLETFECIAPVLEEFFRFLYNKGVLKDGEDIARQVASLSDEIVARSQDSSNWGFSKKFAMNSLYGEEEELAGDLFDKMFSHTNNIFNQPIIKEEKIGRNDPCTCGSGKKYKKCCGNN